MLLDRDAFIEAFGNVDGFRKQGLPVETGWHDFVPSAWKASGEWLDPKEGKGLGPELAKYYQHNPDEAAELIKAAGKYPLETEYTYSGTPPFGTDIYKKQQEVVVEMLQTGGHIKFTKVNTPDHATGFDRQYNFGHGQYQGMSPQPFGTWPEFSQGIFAIYMPGGRNDYVLQDPEGARPRHCPPPRVRPQEGAGPGAPVEQGDERGHAGDPAGRHLDHVLGELALDRQCWRDQPADEHGDVLGRLPALLVRQVEGQPLAGRGAQEPNGRCVFQ